MSLFAAARCTLTAPIASQGPMVLRQPLRSRDLLFRPSMFACLPVCPDIRARSVLSLCPTLYLLKHASAYKRSARDLLLPEQPHSWSVKEGGILIILALPVLLVAIPSSPSSAQTFDVPHYITARRRKVHQLIVLDSALGPSALRASFAGGRFPLCSCV